MSSSETSTAEQQREIPINRISGWELVKFVESLSGWAIGSVSNGPETYFEFIREATDNSPRLHMIITDEWFVVEPLLPSQGPKIDVEANVKSIEMNAHNTFGDEGAFINTSKAEFFIHKNGVDVNILLPNSGGDHLATVSFKNPPQR